MTVWHFSESKQKETRKTETTTDDNVDTMTDSLLKPLITKIKHLSKKKLNPVISLKMKENLAKPTK